MFNENTGSSSIDGHVFPFPHENTHELGLTLEDSVQFIGALVSHVEAGEITESLAQLSRLKDRAFANSLIQYSRGLKAYPDLVQNVEEQSNDTEMSEVSRLAIAGYFGENRSIGSKSEASIPEEEIFRVREDVWLNLASLRISVQSSQGEELARAKDAYDAELALSIKKLLKVGDLEVARDLASGCLTKHGKQVAFVEFDNAVTRLITDAEQLGSLRTLSVSTLTHFGGLTARSAFADRIKRYLGQVYDESQLDQAMDYVQSCRGDDRFAELRQSFDSTVARLVERALLTDNHSDAKRLATYTQTHYGKTKVAKLLGT